MNYEDIPEDLAEFVRDAMLAAEEISASVDHQQLR
jgi:hypothetical protein